MEAPSHFGRFQVLREIGKGAMGVVFEARDPRLDRTVAVKTLSREAREDPDLRDRFTREARTAGVLNHPNIVTVYDVGEQDGTPFLALEYLSGNTLEDILTRKIPLKLSQRFDIIRQAAEGLASAHERGIVHRDIKPGNIMITDEGVVKIMDFGIARAGKGGESGGVVMGSIGYMSPEQARGDSLDARTDIFSLGIVAYELLTGSRAFPGDSVPEVINRILRSDPRPPCELAPELPPGLNPILARVLAKDRQNRYSSALDFANDLKRVWDESQVSHEKVEDWGPAINVDDIEIEEIFGEAEYDSPDHDEEAPPPFAEEDDDEISSSGFGKLLLLVFMILLVIGAGAFYLTFLQKHQTETEKVPLSEIDLLLAEAGDLLAQDRLEEAERKYRQVLNIEPANALAVNRLNQVARQLRVREEIVPLQRAAEEAWLKRDTGEAMRLYEEIVSLLPDNVQARDRLQEIRRMEEIQREYNSSIESALQAEREYRYVEAAHFFRSALALMPGRPEAQSGLARVKRFLTGQEETDKLIEAGEHAQARGDYETAIELWDQAMDLNPSMREIERRIRQAQGRQALQRQLESWRQQARRYQEHGSYEEAIRMWENVLRYDITDREALRCIREAREALSG